MSVSTFFDDSLITRNYRIEDKVCNLITFISLIFSISLIYYKNRILIISFSLVYSKQRILV
ncbi:MAG: hypothetical protein JWP00_3421 [Chloroflexi bacterium]|nr:hypothetical protein [Chloroflexota bacterium]